jgi:hypothetical protein
MSSNSPPPENGHTCHHPDCCSPETGLPDAAHPGGEVGLHHHDAAVHPAMGALKRWLLGFLTFFGIYASSSVCPFCGTPGCPVGLSGAALVGGFFAALWQYGRQGWTWVKRGCRGLFGGGNKGA